MDSPARRFAFLPLALLTFPALAQTRQPAEATAPALDGAAAPALSERIEVTAERLKAEIEAQRSATPGGVAIVEGEDLQRRHVTGMADLLRYVPGVWSESAARAPSAAPSTSPLPPPATARRCPSTSMAAATAR